MNLAILLVISTAIAVVAANKTDIYKVKQVVCPVYTKSVYKSQNIQFDILSLDGNLCTILIVFDKYWHELKDPWETNDPDRDSDYSQITGLRKKYPQLKVLLGIRRKNRDYMDIAEDNTNRPAFVKQATDFVVKYDFDGVDLRWNFLTKGDDPKAARPLLGELQGKLNETSRLLIASCNLGTGDEFDEVEVAKFHTVSDYLAIFHSNPNAKGVDEAFLVRNISYLEDHLKFINSAVGQFWAETKILVGLTFDSPLFITSLNNNQSRLSSWVDYNAICELQPNWKKKFDVETGLAVAKYKNDTLGEEHTIVFESSRSIANKMVFATFFGGAMISATHQDDIRGKCGFEPDTWDDLKPKKNGSILHVPKRNETSFTLLRTANEKLEIYETSNSPYHTASVLVLMGGILAYFLF